MEINYLETILPGIDDYKRSVSFLSIFFKIVFIGGPIVLVIVGLVNFFAQLSDFKILEAIVIFIAYAISAGILLCGYVLVGQARCHNCKHYFVMKDMGVEKYVGTTEREVTNDYQTHDSATTVDWDGNIYHTNITNYHTQYGTETTDHYTFNMECQCCGCVARYKRMKISTRWR